MFNLEFGARVRQLRKQAGLTQRELAELVGVNFTYLSKIEGGTVPAPSEKVIVRLAEVLKADQDELFTLAGKIPPDLAPVLKNREALQLLRSVYAPQILRVSNKIRGGFNVTKQSVTRSIKNLKSLGKVINIKLTAILLIIVLILSVMPALTTLLPVRANPDWTKDTANPVFTAGTWAETPYVLYDTTAGTYKMWYTQRTINNTTFDSFISNILGLNIGSLINHLKAHDFNAIATSDSTNVTAVISYLVANPAQRQNIINSTTSNISSTNSTDGTNWQPPVSNAVPLGTSGQWDSFYVGTPTVIKNSATDYEMWYTGASVNVTAVQKLFQDLSQLSSDNVSTLLQDIIISSNITAFVAHARAARPEGDSYLGTLITDIISIINEMSTAIGHATSTDGGVTWLKDANPVFTKYTSGVAFDQHGVSTPSVIKVGSTYHMWYTGFAIDYGTLASELLAATSIANIQSTILAGTSVAIGHATSSNGVNWTRDATPNIKVLDKGSTWDNFGVSTPSVLVDSTGTYHMWYTGAKGDATTLMNFITGAGSLETTLINGTGAAIGHATSTNGVSWTKDTSNPVLPKDTGDVWDKYGVSSPSVSAIGSNYHMWYTGGGGNMKTLIVDILNSTGLATALTNSGARIAIGHASSPIPTPTPTPAPSGGGGGVVVPTPTPTPTPPTTTQTDLTNIVSSEGVFTQSVTIPSADNKVSIVINAGVTGKKADGTSLTQITVSQVATPPSPPTGSYIVTLTYDFGPPATFSPAIPMTFSYIPDSIPAGFSENELAVAYYDSSAGQWVIIEGATVSTAPPTITVQISHFTQFTVMTYLRPAAFTPSTLTIAPTEVNPGQTVTIGITVSNTGNLQGTYGVTLKVDGATVETKQVSVGGKASSIVTFTTAKDTAGVHNVDVNGVTGSFTVRALPPSPTAPPVPTVSPTPTPKPPVPTVSPTPTLIPVTPPPPISWWLIAAIAAAVIIIATIAWWLIRRRMYYY